MELVLEVFIFSLNFFRKKLFSLINWEYMIILFQEVIIRLKIIIWRLIYLN